jgi:hypothetical protein
MPPPTPSVVRSASTVKVRIATFRSRTPRSASTKPTAPQ